jgi:hypothetical protein
VSKVGLLLFEVAGVSHRFGTVAAPRRRVYSFAMRDAAYRRTRWTARVGALIFHAGVVNASLLDGRLAWRQHDGGHTDGPNWKYFIPWADRQLKQANR